MAQRKEIKRIVATVEKQGWQVQENAGHIKFFAPDGKTLICTGSTPSDCRSLKNLTARLRRSGVQI